MVRMSKNQKHYFTIKRSSTLISCFLTCNFYFLGSFSRLALSFTHVKEISPEYCQFLSKFFSKIFFYFYIIGPFTNTLDLNESTFFFYLILGEYDFKFLKYFLYPQNLNVPICSPSWIMLWFTTMSES